MSVPDAKNIHAKDPNDFNYVSIKNWRRKQNVLYGHDKIANLVGRPGPITGFVLSIVDIVVTLIVKLGVNLITISTFAFNWLYTIIFANFTGIIPSSLTGGTVVSMKFIRYTFTVLMPPFGVLLSKGLYGWFNIIVCMIITYINFFAGIIYAFVITARNRYSDQYEIYSLNVANNNKNNETVEEFEKDSSALLGTCGFVIILGLVFYFFFSYF